MRAMRREFAGAVAFERELVFVWSMIDSIH